MIAAEGGVPRREAVGNAGSLLICLLLPGAMFGALMGYRTDYLGHYLGGFGGMLFLVGLLLAVSRRPLSWDLVPATIVAIAIGAVTESTLFRLAIFDPVDFLNQSLGAALAAVGAWGLTSSARALIGVASLAVLTLAAGFYFAFL